MLHPTRSLAPLLASALALAACGRPNTAQTAICTADADCLADQACDNGTCVPQQDLGCTTNDDCNGTLVCDTASGICVEASVGACTRDADCTFSMHCKLATHKCVECLNASHCATGEVCLGDGSCGADTGGCTSDASCGGLACNTATGACVQCVDDADCPAGQTCRNNSCGGSGDTPPPCAQQADCDMLGKVCKDGQCVPCQADADCGTGRRCASGVCTNDTGSNPPPTGDGTCQSMADCGGQSCFMSYCLPCMTDYMCMDFSDPMSLLTGGKICDAAAGTCIDPQCATAADCPAGQGCYGGGLCGACEANGECRAGEVCNAGTCGAPPPPPPPGAQTFGQSCVPGSTTSTENCAAGLYCLSEGGIALCTRLCIANGKGGDDDCPAGYACHNYEDGALDGAKLCASPAQLAAAAGAFAGAPGATCAAGAECESEVCLTSGCATGCLANDDCAAGKVCWSEFDLDVSPPVFLGDHRCATSIIPTYTAPGGDCSASSDCDSGICAGSCISGKMCNSGDDCTFSCSGVCVDHCRNNADCPADYVCSLWPMDTVSSSNYGAWVPACLPKQFQGSAADGAACAGDGDCLNEWCIKGKCTGLCGTTADCSAIAGTSCQLFTYEDAGTPIFSAGFCL